MAAVQLFHHEDHQGTSFLLSVAFPKLFLTSDFGDRFVRNVAVLAPQWATFNLFFSPCGGGRAHHKITRIRVQKT